MRRLMLAATASSMLLSGCAASTQSRVMLDALVQDCNAGNRDSCVQVPGVQQQVAAEQQANTNTAAAVGIGAVLLGGLLAIAATGRGGGSYHPHHYHR
jgi:hypothetical protein